MPTCFVIQPFDSGKFDKRYKDTFRPAIVAAGLDLYRVDEDASADILFDAIEDGIRDASVCLADITMDNPNVWYELGFALASKTPVVMICSTERTSKYPFDIHHRQITSYRVEAASDFEKLKTDITLRLKSAVEKDAFLRERAPTEPLAPIDGLSSLELSVLALVADGVEGDDGSISLWRLKRDAEKAALANTGLHLGTRRLKARSFIEIVDSEDGMGNIYPSLKITAAGWRWIDANEHRFLTRLTPEPLTAGESLHDDISF